MTTLKAVRGTRDLLPPETALWNRIEATARAGLRPLQLRRDSHAHLRGHRRSLPAAWAKRPTSSRRRCTRGRIAPARSRKSRSPSPCARKTPPAWSAPTSSTSWARPASCRSSITSARSFAASARRRAATGSSGRSAPRSSARPRRAANRRCAMRKCWRCWPPSSTSWASPAGRWS